MSGKQLRITLVKSPIGYDKDQRATLQALGLRKINHSVERSWNKQVDGMVRKVIHLLRLEEV